MATDEESSLVDENQNGTQTLIHNREIYILIWVFLLFYLAYDAAQNLQKQLQEEQEATISGVADAVWCMDTHGS
ncbi:unnamed protein product [Lactuca virosa]|uniref:Uncharacterized protein n=1 Tax=Lactuca virosa TaxID=75947 RepID=A0AAU9LDG9_9ASTR|nr:unnamed protein product [Lactuca virosa]